MNFKNIALATIASAVLLAPISSAFAYTIHYKGGKYSVTCDNGDRWTRGDGSQIITHSDAKKVCEARGSSIMAPDGFTKTGPAQRDMNSSIQKR
ncbi:hypothetical protein JF546_22055 [Nitratireductor aquimarinus]|uniref:hypothetical protein n=1 Tax=Nitratireductor TaxID=245876 RepID=UPI000DDFC9E0|nr:MULTISPECIES: hypothetical protein [Nitratireductor]MBN7775076.1 hypothetical protein [Nitratireductor pacificus]MBN7779937.1 hypothetical protein [Nitratireductor pacificus]MBN7788744.1 hypothetical protein [Nitratireductor aquimarinus]MBN8245704.1 hypothetical protein [Nitratireductor aquimarinus]MBY6097463.1 hypothetical protein [Nitratireductor aquimarinus]